MPASRGRTRTCRRCGALNGPDFDRCVRCAAPFGLVASGIEALGRRIDADAMWGTKAIFALTLLVMGGQLAPLFRHPGLDMIRKLLLGGEHAARFGAFVTTLSVVRAEPLRLLSAVFVHFGLLHFALNMLALGSLGRMTEPAVGTSRFVIAYLCSGVFGFVASVGMPVIFGTQAVFTAGASGAVFGVMGLGLGWLVKLRDRRWRGVAFQAAAYAILINVFPFNVNNAAHVGGLFCGALFGFYYAARPAPRSDRVSNLGAAIGLLLSIASLILAQHAAGWGRGWL